MVDSINNYLESSIDTPEIKDIDEEDIQKIDNLLVDHKSLVDWNNQIEVKFKKQEDFQDILDTWLDDPQTAATHLALGMDIDQRRQARGLKGKSSVPTWV